MNTFEIAKVESFFVGREDHGIRAISITFSEGSTIQGIGSYPLNNKTFEMWANIIEKVFEVPRGTCIFGNYIVGKHCRIFRKDGYFISGIGHLTDKSLRFDFKEEIEKLGKGV